MSKKRRIKKSFKKTKIQKKQKLEQKKFNMDEFFGFDVKLLKKDIYYSLFVSLFFILLVVLLKYKI